MWPSNCCCNTTCWSILIFHLSHMRVCARVCAISVCSLFDCLVCGISFFWSFKESKSKLSLRELKLLVNVNILIYIYIYIHRHARTHPCVNLHASIPVCTWRKNVSQSNCHYVNSTSLYCIQIISHINYKYNILCTCIG